MEKDERDLLEVLKFELEFLEKGGYGRSPRESWRPLFIFEDSPTCMNYDSKENPGPCGDCVLMQLVPREFRAAKIPCRHIPLDEAGETLDSLYRWSDQHEIEDSLENWLRKTISKLENERKAPGSADSGHLPPMCGDLKGIPLHRNLHPKCASPACPTAFHWLGGGKFFRFRPETAGEDSSHPFTDSPGNLHGVKHFWLCERCSHVYTLAYAEGSGVFLKFLSPELLVAEPQKELPAVSHN